MSRTTDNQPTSDGEAGAETNDATETAYRESLLLVLLEQTVGLIDLQACDLEQLRTVAATGSALVGLLDMRGVGGVPAFVADAVDAIRHRDNQTEDGRPALRLIPGEAS